MLPLKVPKNDSRHQQTEADPEPEVMKYEREGDQGEWHAEGESTGVIHLVHAWIQQNQPGKVNMTTRWPNGHLHLIEMLLGSIPMPGLYREYCSAGGHQKVL